MHSTSQYRSDHRALYQSVQVRSPCTLPVSTGQITVHSTSHHRSDHRALYQSARRSDHRTLYQSAQNHVAVRSKVCEDVGGAYRSSLDLLSLPRVGRGRQGDLWPRDCRHRQVMTVKSGVQPLSVPCLTALWSPPSHRPLP